MYIIYFFNRSVLPFSLMSLNIWEALHEVKFQVIVFAQTSLGQVHLGNQLLLANNCFSSRSRALTASGRSRISMAFRYFQDHTRRRRRIFSVHIYVLPQDKQEREEEERKTRIQLYVFISRCIAYPFNAKQPTDLTRRQTKISKQLLETLCTRFQVTPA